MKTTTLKTALGSFIIVGALMLPVATFASTGSTSPSIHINGDGIVRVSHAEVTSVSGNLIQAITRFKNSIMNWVFTTGATTTIVANNSITASSADIHVGDRLNVTGTLTGVGTTMQVQASKVKDITSTKMLKVKSGTVQSVNTGNGTFNLLTSKNTVLTVQTSTSTVFALGTNINQTLASLPVNAKVHVRGVADANSTSIKASSVSLVNTDSKKRRKDFKNVWKDHIKENKHNDNR